jgi:hypothetical protein
VAKKYNEIPVKEVNGVRKDEEEVLQEKKEFKKLIEGEPKRLKRSLLGRLIGGLVGPEGMSGIGGYVSNEVIKPAIKHIIVDAVTSGINMVMYGENNRRGSGGYPNQSRNRGSYRPQTNYTSRYTRDNPPPSDRDRRVSSTPRYGVEEYIIEERYDASHVLTTLIENADSYDTVSIADYYDLIGVPTQYTDNNYGWTHDSISRASILPVRGGYIIKFPTVEVI